MIKTLITLSYLSFTFHLHATSCLKSLLSRLSKPNQTTETLELLPRVEMVLPRGENLGGNESFEQIVKLNSHVNVAKPRAASDYVSGDMNTLRNIKNSNGEKRIDRLFKRTREEVGLFDLDPSRIGSIAKRLEEQAPIEPSLRVALGKAYRSLNNKEKILNYINQLQTDTLALMLKRGGELARKAENGVIDGEIVKEVLRTRMARRGLNISIINPGNSAEEFLDATRYGVILDNAAPSSAHGINVHMVQEDMIIDELVRESGKSYEEVLAIFEKSSFQNARSRIWDDVFDDQRGGVASNPENFNRFLLEPLLNL